MIPSLGTAVENPRSPTRCKCCFWYYQGHIFFLLERQLYLLVIDINVNVWEMLLNYIKQITGLNKKHDGAQAGALGYFILDFFYLILHWRSLIICNDQWCQRQFLDQALLTR